jgi:hypothetical protein
MITEGIVIVAVDVLAIAVLGDCSEASTTYGQGATTELVLARRSATRGRCPWCRRRRKSRKKGYK